MRTLTLILLTLALMLVAGCGERISPEEYAELNARIDTITAYQDTLGTTIRGILGLVPCPPCSPETVYRMPPGRWVEITCLPIMMPSGIRTPTCIFYPDFISGEKWRRLLVESDGLCPDSVFILRGE